MTNETCTCIKKATYDNIMRLICKELDKYRKEINMLLDSYFEFFDIK